MENTKLRVDIQGTIAVPTNHLDDNLVVNSENMLTFSVLEQKKFAEKQYVLNSPLWTPELEISSHIAGRPDIIFKEQLLNKRISTNAASSVQDSIRESHRCIIIEWIFEIAYGKQMKHNYPDRRRSDMEYGGSSCSVTDELYIRDDVDDFSLQHSTVYLVVHLLDTVLRRIRLSLGSQFQLYASGCVLIACKFNEIKVPRAERLVEAAGHCFTPEDLLSVETKILRDVLNYEIPLLGTRYYFLEQFISLINMQMKPCPVACGSRTSMDINTPKHAVALAKSPDSIIEGALYLEAAVGSTNTVPSTAIGRHSSHLKGSSLSFTPSPKTCNSVYCSHDAAPECVPTTILSDKEVEFAHYVSMLVLQMGFNANYYPMSLVAAAILHYTRQQFMPTCAGVKSSILIWPVLYEHITGYKEESLVPVIVMIHTLHYEYSMRNCGSPVPPSVPTSDNNCLIREHYLFHQFNRRSSHHVSKSVVMYPPESAYALRFDGHYPREFVRHPFKVCPRNGNIVTDTQSQSECQKRRYEEYGERTGKIPRTGSIQQITVPPANPMRRSRVKVSSSTEFVKPTAVPTKYVQATLNFNG